MLRFVVALFIAVFSVEARAETPPGTPAPALSAPAPELISALMQHIHAADAVASWRRIMEQPQQFPNVGSATMQAKLASSWSSAVTNAFDVDKAVAALRRDAGQSFSPADLAWHKRFHETELGRKIIAAEDASLKRTATRTRDLAAEMAEVAATQKALEADPPRARAMKRLLAAVGGEEAALDMLLAMQLGTAYGVIAATPKSRPRAEPLEILGMVEQSRPALRKLLAATMLPGFARMYEPLSTREIDAYASALETPAGKRVTSGVIKLMGRTVRNTAIGVGEEFARQMQAEAL